MNIAKFIPASVTSRVAHQVLVTKKNSPTILFVSGVTGVVATTVLACRATLKLEDTLSEIEDKRTLAKITLDKPTNDYDEKAYKHDMTVLYVQSVVKVTKLYAPALIVGALSIGALTGAHNTLNRRNASLTAAYAALDKGVREYRKRVRDEYGEDKERELWHGSVERQIVEETGKGQKITTVKSFDPNTRSPYAKLFNESNLNWNVTPELNALFLRGQEVYANQQLQAKGYLLLNDVYDSLGFERTSAGCVVGWVKGNGDGYVDFGCFDRGNEMRLHEFMLGGRDNGLLLDFNVDGNIYELVDNFRKIDIEGL